MPKESSNTNPADSNPSGPLRINRAENAATAHRNFLAIVKTLESQEDIEQFENEINDPYNSFHALLKDDPEGIQKIIRERHLELLKTQDPEAGNRFQQSIEDAHPATVEPAPNPINQAHTEPASFEALSKTELSTESIAAQNSIRDLSLFLLHSDGIDSPSAGYFSGADLVFLIQQVSKGDAYIEEITREFGLREKVWNLSLELGVIPKSLEYEEEARALTAEETQEVAPEPEYTTPLQQVELPPLPQSAGPHVITLVNGKYVPPAPSRPGTSAVFQTSTVSTTLPEPTVKKSGGFFSKIKKLFGRK